MIINPKLLLDVVYPVGSYYETSDTTFDPNKAWGGTWVEDTKGRVTVAYQNEQEKFNQVGKTGGTFQETITDDNLPSRTVITTYKDSGSYNGITQWDVVDASQGRWFCSNLNDLKLPNGQAMNNLQPYIVVKRWHRTA